MHALLEHVDASECYNTSAVARAVAIGCGHCAVPFALAKHTLEKIEDFAHMYTCGANTHTQLDGRF